MTQNPFLWKKYLSTLLTNFFHQKDRMMVAKFVHNAPFKAPDADVNTYIGASSTHALPALTAGKFFNKSLRRVAKGPLCYFSMTNLRLLRFYSRPYRRGLQHCSAIYFRIGLKIAAQSYRNPPCSIQKKIIASSQVLCGVELISRDR